MYPISISLGNCAFRWFSLLRWYAELYLTGILYPEQARGHQPLRQSPKTLCPELQIVADMESPGFGEIDGTFAEPVDRDDRGIR
jgi:hypothetical protein